VREMKDRLTKGEKDLIIVGDRIVVRRKKATEVNVEDQQH
jgi:hypothetical protein